MNVQEHACILVSCDRQHSPGDWGLGETTANLGGEDFGGTTASLSF